MWSGVRADVSCGSVTGGPIWPLNLAQPGRWPLRGTQRRTIRTRGGIRVWRVGSLAAMGEHPQLGKGGQSPEVAVVDSSYLKHVVRANDNTVPFSFASSVIDGRDPGTRPRVAPLPGAGRVLSRPALLGNQLLRFSGRRHLSYSRPLR